MTVQEQPETTVAEDVSVDQLQTTIKELNSQITEQDVMMASIKSAQQGVDKSNTELRTENEDLRKSLEEKMTVSEQKDYEQLNLKTQNDKLNARLQEIEVREEQRALRDVKLNILRDNNLSDLELIDLLKGNTVDEFNSSIQAYIAKTSKIEKTIKTDLVNGTPPKMGDSGLEIKEMTRDSFDSLDAISRFNVMKDGYTIKD